MSRGDTDGGLVGGLTSVRTSFSPSPIQRLVREDADRLKKVALASCASALASIVLPLPARRH